MDLSKLANSATPSELTALLQSLSEQDRAELDKILLAETRIWEPTPGPQTNAYKCDADILLYGGAAGGGKTDLLLGLALTQHYRTVIYRREATQLSGILDRLTEIQGSRDGYNGQDKVWRLDDNRKIDFGSMPHIGDEQKHQGKPHDLIGFDELTHFAESQFRYLLTWLRSTDPRAKRKRVVCTSNPPTDNDGQWVMEYWGPWLNPEHPSQAKPGELRWYVTDENGKDLEVKGKDDYIIVNGKRRYPMSRTFIPSTVEDNPFLAGTNYESVLDSLPEPLRSQMRDGSFTAGLQDDPWQVIPSAWVKHAQERWQPKAKKAPMDSMGVDVARGGRDETIITRRHGEWFDELLIYPGQTTPDGPSVAAQVMTHMRDAAPVHVDVIGVGASVYDHLKDNNIHAIGVNSAKGTEARDKSGALSFANKRAEMWWRLREALDPKENTGLALPPDPQLKADLCAPKWKLTARGILVESKEDLMKRIGRSTDRGDAVVYGLISTKKRFGGWDEDLPINTAWVV